MADAAPVKAESINLTVRDQTGGEVQFKVKPTTKFSKILTAYCEKKALNAMSVRLIIDGERLKPEDTPEGLGLEDGDIIDCMIEQQGGAAC